jgi:hypothetical protein
VDHVGACAHTKPQRTKHGVVFGVLIWYLIWGFFYKKWCLDLLFNLGFLNKLRREENMTEMVDTS